MFVIENYFLIIIYLVFKAYKTYLSYDSSFVELDFKIRKRSLKDLGK